MSELASEPVPDPDAPATEPAGSDDETAATARKVLGYLVGSLVDDPSAVTIDTDQGRVVALRVRVAPGDMGRVIGRRGRIANAIRTVVRAAAVRDGVEVDVDFVD